MGKIDKVYDERLINPIADRNANRIKVQMAPNKEVTIHFRNLKIVLHKQEEIDQWRDGFRQALENLGEHFKEDI